MKTLIRSRLGISIVIALFTLMFLGGLGLVVNSGRVVLAETTALLVAHKSANVRQVPLGGEIEYTIVLTNTSGGPVTPVVTDTLDHSLAYVEVSPPLPQGVYVLSDDHEVVFGFGRPMVSDEVVTLTFKVDVLVGTLQIGSPVTNTATVDDGTEVFPTNDVVLTIGQPPAVRIDGPLNGELITENPDTVYSVQGVVWDTFDPAPFPNEPVLQPIENGDGDGTYYVQWTVAEPARAFQLEESVNDSQFENPTVYNFNELPLPTQYLAMGKGKGVYYYRLKAYNDDLRSSRWSNVVSATVTSMAFTSQAFSQDTSQFASPLALAATPVVSVSVNDGPWQAATTTLVESDQDYYWEWSYDWTLPKEDDAQYTIRARAADSGGNLGEIDTIVVTIRNGTRYAYFPVVARRWPPIPYPPILNAISNEDEDGDYEVSWSYGSHPGAPVTLGYTLQEATNASFSNATTYINIYAMSKIFTDKEDDTYYYRVRGNNSWGAGEWSNIVSVLVDSQPTYNYKFSSSTEGWGIKRSDEGQGQQLPAPKSIDGSMYHLIVGSADFSILSPLAEAPSKPYTIQARVDIVDNATIDSVHYTAKSEMTYGIIFGGNGGSPCPADRTDPTGCLSHYYRILVAYDQSAGALKWSLKRIDYHLGDSGGGAGQGDELLGWRDLGVTALDWNTWRIDILETTGNNIKIYINDNKLIGEVRDTHYVDDPYFGVFLASPKAAGAIATKWDWFNVTPK